MKKYAVEIESLHTYIVEAEDENAAGWLAQMMLSEHAAPFDSETVSVVVEEIEPGNEPQIYREAPAAIYKNLRNP